MKKIIAILLVMIMMLSLAPFVLANNETDSDNETEVEDNETEVEDNETEVDDEDESGEDDSNDEADDEDESGEDRRHVNSFGTSHGAEMRLAQLERSIAKAIVGGDEVIAYLNGTNTSVLSDIITQLEDVQEKVGAIDINVSAEDSASEFVALKKEARDLVKQFRDEARTQLSDEDRAALKERIEVAREAHKDEFGDVTERINNARKQMNVKALTKFAQNHGVNVSDIREKLESGELNVSGLKKRIREQVNELTDEKKERFVRESKEERTRQDIFHRAVRDEKRMDGEYREENRRDDDRWEERSEIREEHREQNGSRERRIEQRVEVRDGEVRERNREEYRERDSDDDMDEDDSDEDSDDDEVRV